MRKYRILVLDDEPIVCKRLKPSLEKLGYEVETFTESPQALKRIEECNFDIVVTDLKMENIDGIQILESVKRKNPATIVIVITGFVTAEAVKDVLKKGAFDFIAKPFRLEDLRSVILKAINKIEEQSKNV
jgi:DNA-binding NtrC family response regulator